MAADIAQLGIDVDSRSAQDAASALDTLAEAAKNTAPAVDEVGKSSKTTVPAIDQVGKGAKTVAPALDAVTRTAKTTAPAIDAIGKSAKTTVPALEELAANSNKVVTAATGLGRISTTVGNGMQRFGPQIQQGAYQLSDFAVQVQGGTDALRAFSQQAPQFLAIFGPAGALAGAVIGIAAGLASSLIPALFSTGDGMDAAGGKANTFAGQLDALTGSADAAAAKLGELNAAQRKVIEDQSNAAADKAGKAKTKWDMFWALLGDQDPTKQVDVSPPVFAPGTPEAAYKQAKAREQSLYPTTTPEDILKYQQEIAQRNKQARDALPKFDPQAEYRKANSLYPDESAQQTQAYANELNARVKADHDKQEAAAKAEANRLKAAAKARADHAKSVKDSLDDMTAAANTNAEAMAKQEAAMKGGASNSIQLEGINKQVRAVQDQAAIESQLRRFRGEASAEQIEQARTALQAQAEAKRSLEDQTKLVQDQVAWETKLAAAKRDRAQADQEQLKNLQQDTARMVLQQQRDEVEKNRQAFMNYGQVAFDALGQIAMGGEKANVALTNMLKTWANMAFQMASQMALRAIATWLFPNPTGAGTALAGVGATGSGGVAGHAASGSDVDGGRTYIVGEHGRERFTPWTRGKVEPMRGGSSSGQSMNISTTNNIQLSGSATHEDADRMAKAIDKKMNETIDARLARHARAGGAYAA